MSESADLPSISKPWLKSYPVDIDYDADLPARNIADIFDDSVKKYGERTFTNLLGKKMTYREVGDLVDRFAKGLQEQGLGKGSTVALALPNVPFYTIAYYAAMKIGAKVANINPLYPENKMEHLLSDSDADVVVTLNMAETAEAPFYKGMDAVLKSGKTPLKKIIYCEMADALPTTLGLAYRAINTVKSWLGKPVLVPVKEDATHVSFNTLLKNDGKYTPVSTTPDEVAVLQYTGGTTGLPKAAALTHTNLSANIEQSNLWFTGGKEKADPEKFIAILPFFHVFGMTVEQNMAMKLGAEVVMIPKLDKKKPEKIFKIIKKEGITIFSGIPSLYKLMIDQLEKTPYNLPSLKVCVSGAAPLPEATAIAFKRATGLEIVEGYGLSETSPIATANPVHGVKKTNSAGLPVPGTTVKIVEPADIDPDAILTEPILPGKEVPITVGGEICLRGPQVMQGYWKKQSETFATIDKEGFFHTGDFGHIGEDGYLYITDRIKDMIIVSGFKVFPRDVEEALLKHPDISEVVVVGAPKAGAEKEEEVKAFIVMREGKTLTPENLRHFLEEGKYLVSGQMPKQVEFRDSLPKTLIGKPDRKVLRDAEKAKVKKPPAAPKP